MTKNDPKNTRLQVQAYPSLKIHSAHQRGKNRSKIRKFTPKFVMPHQNVTFCPIVKMTPTNTKFTP